MKKHDVDITGFSHAHQAPLRFVQSPARGHDAAILVAVRVTDHDRLPIEQTFQMLTVNPVRQQGLDDFRSCLQVIDGFQQWSHVQVGRRSGMRVRDPGQGQRSQHVIRTLGHADDKQPDRSAAVHLPRSGNCPEHGQRFRRLI